MSADTVSAVVGRESVTEAWCGVLSLPGVGAAAAWAVAVGEGPVAAWAELCAGRIPDCWATSVGRRRRDEARTLLEAAAGIDAPAVAAAQWALGVTPTWWGDEAHPALAAHDPHVPPVVWWRGVDRPDPGRADATAAPVGPAGRRPAVAVVGTRRASRAGVSIAAELGAALVSAGCDVVSGLALGIDAAAHRGALSVVAAADRPPGGVTGVVGTGLDVVYPRRHADLWADVVRHGRLCSEQLAGTGPAAWRFPARNRILVALCDAVVVVESHRAGGSLITATLAGDRGVPVLAVPGSIRSPASEGTNRLIAEGCAPCLGVEDVLAAVGLGRGAPELPFAGPGPAVQSATRVEGANLDVVQRRVLEAIGGNPITYDELADAVAADGVGVGAVVAAVARLVALGLVDEEGGRIERVS